MTGQPALSLDLDRLPVEAVVADLVYVPLETALLKAARARGLRTVDGVPATDLVLRTADDATLARRVETWRERGLLRVDGGRARLSEEGFLLSDALFVELL